MMLYHFEPKPRKEIKLFASVRECLTLGTYKREHDKSDVSFCSNLAVKLSYGTGA